MSNATRLKRYKARKKARGAHRLDVWITGRAWRNLQAMNTLGETMGETLERLLRTRRSGKLNFQDALNRILNGPE
jgi:hypothetical protein